MRWTCGAVVLALGITHSFAQSPPPLLLQVYDASLPTPPRAFAAFPVGINFAELNANPESLSIQLPGTGLVTAMRTKFMPRNGGYDWIGKAGVRDVILSVDANIVTGFIRGGAETFSLLSDVVGQNVQHTLLGMNPDSFPEDVVLEAPLVKGATPSQPDRICFGKDFEPIDLLVIYSAEALAAVGGEVAVMENSIFNAVASANVTLWNSAVPTSFNLLAIQPAPASLPEVQGQNDVLNAIQNADVRALRQQWQADVLTYVTSIGFRSPGVEYCGIAPTQRRAGSFGYGYAFAPNAVNVVTWSCGVQNNDLSHEAAHNAGLDHNPGFTLSTPQQNLFPYAFGHHVNGVFRDDMSGSNDKACPEGCPRQMFFSDPTQDHDGLPRGVEGERDNAQVYRKMFRCVNTFGEYVFADGLG